jgi:MtN3 and saliva related transmembrane protein
MQAADIVGFVGAAASVASFAPQAWKIIRTRDTEGLSLGMYALTCLAFASWLAFGLLTGQWPIIVPNALCLLLAAFILLMVALPDGKTRKVAETLDPEA